MAALEAAAPPPPFTASCCCFSSEGAVLAAGANKAAAAAAAVVAAVAAAAQKLPCGHVVQPFGLPPDESERPVCAPYVPAGHGVATLEPAGQ
jgi:hypothetical protein